MTGQSPRSTGFRRVGATLLAAVLLVAILPSAVLAAATVNSATGGGNISADTTGGAFTALTGPSITVTAADDIDPGTITITAPVGFEFDTSGSPSVTVGATGAEIALTSDTSSVITYTVTTGNTSDGTVTFSGVRVRPTAGTPLATGDLQVGGTAGVSDATAGTLTEVAGTPDVDFTNATIGDAAAGALLSPQPVVHAEDQFGNDSYSVALTIKPGTGTTGATVVCSPASPIPTDGSGDANFAGCHIDTAGTNYRLLATVAGVTAESTLFDIVAGDPTKLVMTVQPTNATLSDTFPSQPVVEVQDASGNRVLTDDATVVTLALTTGTGTLTCSGGLSKTVTDGRAMFSGCSISSVGIGKVITATSSPARTPDASDPFDVSDRLVFNPNPSPTASAGVAFTVQPKVEVRAGTTSVAVNDDFTIVTLSIKAGTGATGALLTCDGGLSKTVVNGVATYAGCKIDKISPTSPANPYKIVAAAANLTTAESTNVAITAGPATKLGFTAQPTAGVASQAFPIQPVVAVQDAGGNTVITGNNSTATVTLSLAAGAPAGAVLTCTGGLSKAAVAGVATFAGCMVNAAGTYRLVATASNLVIGTTVTPVTGNSFIVTAPTAVITLTTSAPIPPGAQNPVILWGQGFTLSVQFGTNGASKQFQLQGTRDLVTWTTITTLTTDANGRASLFYTPVTNLYYRAVFSGAPDLGAANSNQVRTVVRQLGILRPTNRGSIKTISRGSSITFTTTVRPARPELAPAQVSFYLYKRVSGVWTRVSTRNVFIDGAGLARTTFTFNSTGDYYVRSQANPTPYNANSVLTQLERYNVR
jgi:hypothetical protein